jgi:hypothetical protein
MVIGPPLSEATFTPECGGNSNSLSEMPAVRIIVLENTRPGYCVVSTVLSGNPSKVMVIVLANSVGLGSKARRRTKSALRAEGRDGRAEDARS